MATRVVQADWPGTAARRLGAHAGGGRPSCDGAGHAGRAQPGCILVATGREAARSSGCAAHCWWHRRTSTRSITCFPKWKASPRCRSTFAVSQHRGGQHHRPLRHPGACARDGGRVGRWVRRRRRCRARERRVEPGRMAGRAPPAGRAARYQLTTRSDHTPGRVAQRLPSDAAAAAITSSVPAGGRTSTSPLPFAAGADGRAAW